MTVQRKNYSALGEPVGPYVHATQCAGMLFLSGLTAFGTPAQGGRIADQARAIFQQIERIAASEGVNLTALAKVTIFVTSFEEVDALREVLFETYGKNLPASSLVQVAALFSADLNIEVEAVLCLG